MISLRCLCAAAALAALLPLPAGAETRTPVQVIQTTDRAYPLSLIFRGVTQGAVRAAVVVDEQGRLEEHFIVAYSAKPLAEITGELLREWKFRPATIDGRPIAVQTTLELEFRVSGVVISQHITEHYLGRITADRIEMEYEPCSLRDLDRIPTPIAAAAPMVSPDMLAGQTVRETTVNFFIDEQGQVRMPAIAGGNRGILGEAAMAAVRTWRFEPPTRRGQPVLVQASQQFLFTPAAAGSAPASTP